MKKNRRILHISPTNIRNDCRILKEINTLKQIPNCNLKAFGIDDYKYQNNTNEVNQNIKIFKILTSKLKLIPRPIRYFLILLESMIRLTFPAIKFKPEIIHCHDTLFLPIALIVKYFCKCVIIYDAHELESNKNGQSKILSEYTLFIEKIAWPKIDLLITVSPSIINWYNTNLGTKKSILILNSPITKAINVENLVKGDYLCRKFNINKNEKIFVYIGILGKGRGIDFYLECFKKSDIFAHIVFIGSGEYEEKIKNMKSKYKNIHYHPAVNHDQVVEISKSADFGLCLIENISLSDYYCLPNKLFEYAFSGLNILASNFPDIKCIIDKYSLGQCCDLNSEDVHKAIKALQKQEVKKITKDLTKLSWNYQSDLLIREYNMILTNNF